MSSSSTSIRKTVSIHQMTISPSSSLSSSSSSSSTLPWEESEFEELKHMSPVPPPWRNNKKRLTKQLSMCEMPRDVAWEKQRHRMFLLERRKNGVQELEDDVTDEDLNELKGCIELGFGFNEKIGQGLCNTLPALDLYFQVNRQFSPSPVSSPRSTSSASLGVSSSSFESPRSDSDSWKLLSPGDDPQQVKTKLRHWAQLVACSVMQSQ
ncbi:Protein of unknown function DUF1685 [Dillenia turbinata]|uniref:Uncharacterized protein n=1 Tax=Dillenia turbinata TaxID=194707 RepID=A0AAN8URK2_9MAGN